MQTRTEGRDRERPEEQFPNIENRLRNLAWTISGDYALDVQTDAALFLQSKAMALYDAIRQGAFARCFDAQKLASYLLKKIALGADASPLMDIEQICVDEAVYPLVRRERSGTEEIRRQAFRDGLAMDSRADECSQATVCLNQLRRIRMLRFLKTEEESVPPELEKALRQIEALGRNSDTDSLIETIDALYNSLVEPNFVQEHGDLQKVRSVVLEEAIAARQLRELTPEQLQEVLDTYMQTARREMLRMRHSRPGRMPRAEQALPPEDVAVPAPAPDEREKVRAYMERNFGESFLSGREQERLECRLCTGMHRRCSLYLTQGILQNPALRSTQYLRSNMQRVKNEIYYSGKSNAIRRNTSVLAAMLRQLRIERLDEDSCRADHGRLQPARLWKVGRVADDKLFDLRKKREDAGFVVDVLMDGSSSQSRRQPQVAVQAYIISRALSEANIPHRVCSFCSFWDYTILHRFRDYEDVASADKNILQFQAIGENRDGLAIRVACDALDKRTEERKILILLSDGRPNHIGSDRPGSRRPLPYAGEEAIRDTALEVRKARGRGISVLGIFIGDERDLAAEKRIFGKEFVYIRNIHSFAHVVGTYLRRQMEEEELF